MVQVKHGAPKIILGSDSTNTSQLGNIGESRVLYEFVKNNIPCYLPYGDGSTADLVAEFNGKLNRIQIKTTETLNKLGAMEWHVTKQNGYHGSRTIYDINTIDYFAFYCIETDIVCLVPYTENFPSQTISIRLDDFQGRRLKTMRFASEYSVQTIANK